MNIELKTISELFRVGSTENSCFNRREFRKFRRIDKNHDGVLSESEILQSRKREAKLKTVRNIAGFTLGAVALVAGIKHKERGIELLSLGGGSCLGAFFSQLDMESEREITKAYEKEHNLNAQA